MSCDNCGRDLAVGNVGGATFGQCANCGQQCQILDGQQYVMNPGEAQE